MIEMVPWFAVDAAINPPYNDINSMAPGGCG